MMQLGAWKSSDEEKRHLRLKVSSLQKAIEAHRKARKKLEQENRELNKKLEQALKTIKQLMEENDKLQRQRDRFRDMVFKPNNNKTSEEEKEELTDKPLPKKKRKRGGQKGHKGTGRKKPEHIDDFVRVFLSHCPDCSTEVARSHTIETHIVEDIPPFEECHSKVVRYETEVQWCPKCKKIIKGKALGVIPGSRLGINILLYVLFHKYLSRCSWESIEKNLQLFYGVKVSRGALVAMMHRVRKWLGPKYKNLLETIRSSPVKHADETSWRKEKLSYWVWGFFTNSCAYYTITESRGKGIPQEILAGSHPKDVLVRDDYGSYNKIPLKHQSCWAHLLRKSHEEAVHPKASLEVKELHETLKDMFNDIEKIIKRPFDYRERKIEYKHYSKKIQSIIITKYKEEDSKRIQTRIRNQNKNLITALLYKNVPLTNNLAERQIRPLAVIRKISGESKSDNGTLTTAVIMSVLQTLRLQKKNLVKSIKESILSSL
jgi:transposase